MSRTHASRGDTNGNKGYSKIICFVPNLNWLDSVTILAKIKISFTFYRGYHSQFLYLSTVTVEPISVRGVVTFAEVANIITKHNP